MKALAINGSPRKGWNTDLLLGKALEGAASTGYSTELIHLSDINFKGCTGCLECKRKGGKSLWACAVKDELTSVLKEIAECDAMILGSPIYFSEVTGMMRSFLERLLFPYVSYDEAGKTLFDRRIPILFIYTMNMPKAALDQIGYYDRFKSYEQLFGRMIGPCRTLVSTETLQTKDYSPYHMAMFDENQRKQRRDEIFPIDCKKAYYHAVALVSGKTVVSVSAMEKDLDEVMNLARYSGQPVYIKQDGGNDIVLLSPQLYHEMKFDEEYPWPEGLDTPAE